MSPSTLYVFDGQSNGLSPFTLSQSYPHKFRAQARPDAGLRVANIGSTTYAERTANATTRVDWWLTTAERTVWIDDGGEEELKDGMDAENILAAMLNYATARRAAGADVLVALTTPPSNYWSAPQDAVRLEVNDDLLNNPEAFGYDYTVDIGSIPELQDPDDTDIYFDGVHYTDAATTIVAQALADAGL